MTFLKWKDPQNFGKQDFLSFLFLFSFFGVCFKVERFAGVLTCTSCKAVASLYVHAHSVVSFESLNVTD